MSFPRKLQTLTFLVFIFITLQVFSQDIPDRPVPPRLVNDYAGILTSEQAASLESRLVTFNDSTSTQVTVVIVKSLNGYDKADFAYRLGQKWGVGQKGKNNGVVILIKPKAANERGDAFIAPGYGLEAVLPDATCKRIVDNEMIPRFREGDYYGGIDAAVTTIMTITKGEYTAEQYNKKINASPYGLAIPIFILILVILWIRITRRRMHTVGKSLPFWTLFWLGSMGGGKSGSWGNFRSGSGSFGSGSSGGFGGFGGGSFGGGGAGGSW